MLQATTVEVQGEVDLAHATTRGSRSVMGLAN